MNFHTSIPNPARPMLPIAAPAASALTASAARFGLFIPACSFRSLSCFSISVALAGKIAGNAKNNPPTTGPYSFAINPAVVVINPPNTNRTAYSYHFVLVRAEGLIWIFICGYRKQRYHSPKAVPTHSRTEELVTARAFHLQRIMIPLIQDA